MYCPRRILFREDPLNLINNPNPAEKYFSIYSDL
ncbi:hypothetical protein GGQ85_000742 [Nitrobacter vulgaris]|nr:hypothetical protein [Nitrobacter vulgaris]